MNYILLIYANESEWTTKPPQEMEGVMQQHAQLESDLRRTGTYRGCGGLAPTSAATTLRLEKGRRQVTDGPYIETREQLGGYYVIEAKDLDAALEIAARIPMAAKGGIEIRPIMDLRLP